MAMADSLRAGRSDTALPTALQGYKLRRSSLCQRFSGNAWQRYCKHANWYGKPALPSEAWGVQLGTRAAHASSPACSPISDCAVRKSPGAHQAQHRRREHRRN
eukprot:358445-Chlamydomonas_euryale.AAC.36